ncbi:MAG: hypothetical protein RLY31_2358 [Bacteroidota bacterium]|jgi:hypothetical protein
MMIRKTFYALAFGLLALSACQDDEPSVEAVLRYDGENATGPFLEQGEHELAIHFPASTMADYTGRELTEVSFFVGDALPAQCQVRVYRGGTVSPGGLEYSFDVTDGLQTLRWNRHILSSPLALEGDDLWISVFVTHAVGQQSIGCDAGPRKDGGDWLYQEADGSWQTYQQRTTESVNWNIRGTTR